ncbi:MAG: glycosyltransferase family 39 protein [Bacteroidota bacterium]
MHRPAESPSAVPGPAGERLALLPPILVCLVFAVLAACQLNETMIYTPDSAHYLAWARSLAVLDGWRVTLGAEPFRYVFNAPLYPLFLAPAALLFPFSIIAGKIVTALFGITTLALLYRFAASHAGRWFAFGGTLTLALHPLFGVLSTQVLSDVPFAAAMLGFLILAGRYVEGHDGAGTTAALIAIVTGALFLREVGFAIVAAAVAYLVALRRYRSMLLLLLVVGISYGLWYLRNEVAVGSVENPDLRNFRLVFSRLSTDPGSTFSAELLARISNGIRFYGPALGTLLFSPLDHGWPFELVRSTDPLLSALRGQLPLLRVPFTLLSVVLCGAGAITLRNDRRTALLLVAFGGTYGLILLLYPILDIRFLLPALILMTWLALKGVAALVTLLPAGLRRPAAIAAIIVIALAEVPNLLWDRSAIATNLAYLRSPEEFTSSVSSEDPSPNELTLIPRDAAKWIAANSPPASGVISLYKDAGFWLGGRPVLTPGPFVAIDDFDGIVRDYGVGFLLTGLHAHEVHDFEAQMALSTRYRFVPVYRAGDTEVFRVEGKTSPRAPSIVLASPVLGPLRRLFLSGILAIRAGRYPEAVEAFRQLQATEGLRIAALYYTAVALECDSRLETADSLYGEFSALPQAAHYLQQVQYHREIIGLIREAERSDARQERASLFHSISLSYWILGLRHRAVTMLDLALQTDPQLYIGQVFGTLYALAEGDTVLARTFVAAVRRTRPSDPLTFSLGNAMSAIDSLRGSTRPSRLELEIGRQYVAAGLYELGIDQATKAFRADSTNSDALRLLSDLYIRKHRIAPALGALRRLSVLRPDDVGIKAEIRQISR